MNVVVLAGGVLGEEDPLYDLISDGTPKYKAFLTAKGVPILQWVLDALGNSPLIENIILVGQSEQNGFTSSKPIYFLEDQGNIIENVVSGVRYSSQISPSETHSMVATGDIPLVNQDMVSWVVENGQKYQVDLAYHIVKEEVMEARFPGSNRTYTPLKGMRVCGADLNVISHQLANENTAIWEDLTAARKSPFKLAAVFGPRLLAGLVFRQLELEKLAEDLGGRLGLTAKAIICPYAEMAMDVDKPHQLELIRKELGGP